MSEAPFTTVVFEGNVLRPYSKYDLEMIAERYKPTTRLKAKFTQQRSRRHTNLYWAVLRTVIDNTELWANVDALHHAIKAHLRMFGDSVLLLDGTVEFSLQSINFDAMDQGAFKLFFEQAMTAIGEFACLDMHDIIRETKRQVNWTSEDERAFQGRS